MDITKLMIGDWVWCGSNYGKVAEIFILHDSLLITVNNRRNKYFEEVNPFEVTTDAEDIRPIPLTQEILEKNGFKHEEAFFFIGENSCIKMISPDCFVLHLEEAYSVQLHMICHFVHELQHALRLAKIDKNIEL